MTSGVYVRTAAMREKMSLIKKGSIGFWKGKKRPNISMSSRISMLKRWAAGMTPPNKGKKHTEEWKKNISKAHKKNPKIKEAAKKGAQARWANHIKIWTQEKNNESSKRWKLNNREKVRFYNHNRKMRKKKVGGSHTVKEWIELLTKCNFTCQRCHTKLSQYKITRDHILSIHDGGKDDICNIQPLCGRCNSIKHTKNINYMKT